MPARCTLSHQSRSHGHGTEDNPLAEDIHAICNILASKAPSPTKYDRELLLNEINLNDVLVTWVKLLIWTHTHIHMESHSVTMNQKSVAAIGAPFSDQSAQRGSISETGCRLMDGKCIICYGSLVRFALRIRHHIEPFISLATVLIAMPFQWSQSVNHCIFWCGCLNIW